MWSSSETRLVFKIAFLCHDKNDNGAFSGLSIDIQNGIINCMAATIDAIKAMLENNFLVLCLTRQRIV